ncbi:MAG: RNA methyltransferase [Patescibacteria group bacterium]
MLTKNRLNRIKSVASLRQSGLVLVFEDIHDPHNAAAILRTCDAFGLQQVYFIFEQEKYYNPKKIGKSSSSTANKWLDFQTYKSTKTCLQKLKKDGFTLVATLLNQEAKDIFKAKFNQPKIAILIGNEHRGLSPLAAKMADEKIYIPMRGMVQSLNVSVTTAIILFEITRQRLKSKKNYQLSLSKKRKLVKNFLQR